MIRRSGIFSSVAATRNLKSYQEQAQSRSSVLLPIEEPVADTNFALTATEEADTAVFTGTDNAALSATEQNDTASFALQESTNGLALAATEGADTAAVSVNVNAALASTEASDVASASVAVTVRITATEASDTASVTVRATVALTGTELPDTAFVAVNDSVNLGAVEEADVAGFALAEVGGLALAATEDGDTANFAVSPVVEGGVGGGVIRFSSPGSAYINSYKSQIKRAKKKLQAAKENPLLAMEREFQQALTEAYLAYSQLVLILDLKEKERLEKEAEALRKAAYEVELKAVALRAQRALEEEEEELLAANLW